MGTWTTRGLRGSTLEEMINRTNEKYREKKLALVQKIAEKIEERNHKKDVERFIDQAFAAPVPAEGEADTAATEELVPPDTEEEKGGAD